MDQLSALVDAGAAGTSATARSIAEATACLDRFTVAFNAGDIAAMDAELHFPHVMLSGGEQLVWAGPGQHPAGLFASLRASGWASTRYESRVAVAATEAKVHFVLRYTRRDGDGKVLSEHENLWVVVRRPDRWGIAWRSY